MSISKEQVVLHVLLGQGPNGTKLRQSVVPAKAGIHLRTKPNATVGMGPRLRGDDVIPVGISLT